MSKTIQIRFVQDPGISSKLICWWTWGKWSHVEAFAEPGNPYFNQVGYFGARLSGGVQLRRLDYVRPLLQQIRKIEVSDAQYAAFWQFMKDQEGKPYDLIALTGFGLRGDLADGTAKWFCSELVFAAFKAASIEIIHGEVAYRFSPRDVGLSTLLLI